MSAGTRPQEAGTASRFGRDRLYRDATALASTSMINAGLGALFWAIAAAIVPPSELGVQTALIAIFTGPAVVIATGIGDAYAALIPAVGTARAAVFEHGQRVFWGLTTVAGIVAASAALLGLRGDLGSPVAAGLLVLGCTVTWSAFLLQYNTLTSVGRARWLPPMSGIVSLGKIVFLVGLVATAVAYPVLIAAAAPAVLVIVALQPRIRRIVLTSEGLPTESSWSDHAAVQQFRSLSVRTLLAVALSIGVLTVTPFLVTAVAGPSEGALFALALNIVLALDFVVAALTASLVVHGSGSPDVVSSMARSILVRATCLIALGGAAVCVVVPVVLRMLNEEYVEMNGQAVVILLSAACLVKVVFLVWSALQRVRRTMGAVLVVNAVSATVMLVALPPLASRWGAVGGAAAVLIAQAALTVGALICWARGRASSDRRGAVR